MTTISAAKGLQLMTAEKQKNRTWTDHYQYLTYVAERSGCSDLHVLQNLCKSSPAYLESAMLTRLNSQRVDYLQQATELVAFAIEFEENMVKQDNLRGQGGRGNRGRGGRFQGGGRGAQGGRAIESVARVGGTETRKCYNCGEVGALSQRLPRVSLAVGTGTGTADSHTWIMDSGSSVHLVKEEKLPQNAVDCDEQYLAANGVNNRVIKGSVELKTIVDGHEVMVDLSEVYYAKNLQDNIISYGRLEEKGVYLEQRNGKSYTIHQETGVRVFEVHRRHKVLVIDVLRQVTKEARINAITKAVQEAREALEDAATETTLLELHKRLGHISYDTVERMADAVGFGIKLTSRLRLNCLTCAQGKQSKNNQSKKDSCANAPIDKIGGVIGSDIKGPMTPKDRRGNRYLIDFVDYSTNYVRVFLAKKKGPRKKSKKTSKKKNPVAASGDAAEVDGAGNEGDEQVPVEEEQGTRMRTRNMGAKHVPVGRVNSVVHEDPKNYRQSMKDPRADKWKQAIKVEIEALEQNGTWWVAKKPPGAKCLHTKWVFKLKTHADGTIEQYKARLVARGDEQEYGVDYFYTFSAVLEMVSGRVILVVSRIWTVPARHGDVPSAYEKAKKEAELIIILLIPQGMEFTEEQLKALGMKSKYELVLILEQGLYGLKQSGRLNHLLHSILLVSLGFRLCYTDSCLYVKAESDGMTLVGIYVDDILVTGTSVEKVDKFFNDMKIVELKDLGVVSKFLGIAFHYDDEDGWTLGQEQVTQDMLVKFGLGKAATVHTPIGGELDDEEPGKLLPSGGAGNPGRPTVQTFQSLVGSLLWIARCTRPDVAFAVHRVTRNSHAPREADWRLAKRIAMYLKGTKELKYVMNTDEVAVNDDGVLVEAFSDADYAADKKDRKSVTGGVLMVAGVVVAWLCKKQACVALSTMESEFVAASQTTAEMLSIMECLEEIGLKLRAPSVLHVDNQAAIAQLEGVDTSGRAKHIDTRHKFVKDFVKKKVLSVEYCESKVMRADILMKTLPAPRLKEMRGLVMLSG